MTVWRNTLRVGIAVAALTVAALPAQAQGPSSVTAPMWDRKYGYHDEHDYESGDMYEYGVDVALPAGLPIFAPEEGTVVAYRACEPGMCWGPGRVFFKLDRGGMLVLGHVTRWLADGDHVAPGTQIATIGDNGGNSHVEVMFSPSNTAFDNRRDFTFYPLGDRRAPGFLMQAYMHPDSWTMPADGGYWNGWRWVWDQKAWESQ